MPEFHTEAPQATVSEGLAQGPYMAARVEVEPMTIRTKGVDSTKAPPRPYWIPVGDQELFCCKALIRKKYWKIKKHWESNNLANHSVSWIYFGSLK